MYVRIASHRDPEPLDLEAFVRLAEFVLEREDVPDQAELSLAVVDIDEMTELNTGYRDAEGATDVLSFGCDDPCPVEGDEPITLGDVVVAPEIAQTPGRGARPHHRGRAEPPRSCTGSSTCWATSTTPTREPL